MTSSPTPEAVAIVRRNSAQVALSLPDNQVAQSIAQLEAEQSSEEHNREQRRLEWQEWIRFNTFDGSVSLLRQVIHFERTILS
jgi:hypothetical protein